MDINEGNQSLTGRLGLTGGAGQSRQDYESGLVAIRLGIHVRERRLSVDGFIRQVGILAGDSDAPGVMDFIGEAPGGI